MIALLIGASTTTAAQGQSLWQHRCDTKTHLFWDKQARTIGDVLTIVIRENTDVQNRDEQALDRNSSSQGGFGFQASRGGNLGTGASDAALDLDTNGSGSFDGTAERRIAREFVDRISVIVTDVQPNGNMVVVGERKHSVADDHRVLRVCGIVRPYDIQADNSVSSQNVANFRMEYYGKGSEQEFTKQGWLGRAWNAVRPF